VEAKKKNMGVTLRGPQLVKIIRKRNQKDFEETASGGCCGLVGLGSAAKKERKEEKQDLERTCTC